ncbi:hypothetical protein BaRGS_00038134 [Batillaria attramentaria]|uniref:Uncharacterized protein n=1 Tax=Batillaria attramentaria TaxID=370345 RepID=A0ABD0J6V1_9CAEN
MASARETLSDHRVRFDLDRFCSLTLACLYCADDGDLVISPVAELWEEICRFVEAVAPLTKPLVVYIKEKIDATTGKHDLMEADAFRTLRNLKLRGMQGMEILHTGLGFIVLSFEILRIELTKEDSDDVDLVSEISAACEQTLGQNPWLVHQIKLAVNQAPSRGEFFEKLGTTEQHFLSILEGLTETLNSLYCIEDGLISVR